MWMKLRWEERKRLYCAFYRPFFLVYMFHIRLSFFIRDVFDVVLVIVGLLSSYVSFCCCNEIHLFASTPRCFLSFLLSVLLLLLLLLLLMLLFYISWCCVKNCY